MDSSVNPITLKLTFPVESFSIFIIEKSARDMLGSDAYLLNSFINDINIDDIKVNISKKINEIYKLNKK